jgi:hypothetical protein
MPEIAVDRLPEFQKQRFVVPPDRFEFAEPLPLRLKPGGRLGKGCQLFWDGETIPPTVGFVPQDDAVGHIERQSAAREAMRGPGKVHALNITGKMLFDSYKCRWRNEWPTCFNNC